MDDLDGQLNEAAASADEQQERGGVWVGWRWGGGAGAGSYLHTIVQDVQHVVREAKDIFPLRWGGAPASTRRAHWSFKIKSTSKFTCVTRPEKWCGKFKVRVIQTPRYLKGSVGCRYGTGSATPPCVPPVENALPSLAVSMARSVALEMRPFAASA